MNQANILNSILNNYRNQKGKEKKKKKKKKKKTQYMLVIRDFKGDEDNKGKIQMKTIKNSHNFSLDQ